MFVNLTRCSRCNSSSRCCYRACGHVDPASSRKIRCGGDSHPEPPSSPGSVGLTRAHPLKNPRLWSLPARIGPVTVHPTRWGVGPQLVFLTGWFKHVAPNLFSIQCSRRSWRLLWILCDTLARWLEAVSSTLVEMVTHARKLPGRQEVLPCCGEDVDIEHWRLGGQYTQINRRVCRSSDDGCFPEMTRRVTMP